MASVLTPQVMGWLRWVFVEVNDMPFDLCWTAHVAFSRREWKYNSYLYALASCMVVRTGSAIVVIWRRSYVGLVLLSYCFVYISFNGSSTTLSADFPCQTNFSKYN